MSNNKIYSTTEYGVFNKLRGNRAVNELHVRRLVEAIKEKDLQIPIIVDHDMNVLDGQHRLDAYKIVGNPITYIIKDKFELQDVRNVNSVNRKWTLTEYLMSYCKLGKKDYQLLEWFHRTYEFGIAECVAMLNGKGYTNVNILKEFRKGEFVIDDLEQGKTWAKNINACGEYFQYYKKATFIKAMLSAMKDKTFSFKIFFKRLSNNSSKLKNQGSRNDFIVNIERLYNHGTANKFKVRLDLYDYKR
jgi:hypothetical protein|tara:strand:- start:51 stop:788 length:738 start_codon:yes stop_codon:yes gene_type:complete